MKTSQILKTIVTAAIAVLLTSAMAFALPTLQLDINGGTYYDSGSETIITGADEFTVYAYATPNGGDIMADLDNPAPGEEDAFGNVSATDILADTYYLSVALTPRTEEVIGGLDLGFIRVNGVMINVTSGMIYGNPPAAATANPELAPHGVFETYYKEIEFTFADDQTTAAYNTQDRAINDVAFTDAFDPAATTDPLMFYRTFDVDVSGLADGYEIHFDLYSSAYKAIKERGELVGFDVIRGQFAPYSHDAGTGDGKQPVPEPATMILLGSGLLGIGVSRRRKK